MSRVASVVLLSVLVPACSLGFAGARHQQSPPVDAGNGDAPTGEEDASMSGDDTGPIDGGVRDPDAFVPDAFVPDAFVPDGGEACDRDDDGYLSIACGGDDCDDTDAAVYPFAPPICGNGRAESCSLEAQEELLVLLGAAEIGLLEPVRIAAEPEIAPDIAIAMNGTPTQPLGAALVAFRVRRDEDYTLAVRQLDLGTGERFAFDFFGDGLVAHAVGAGAGAPDPELATVVAAASHPDDRTMRGMRVELGVGGGGGANSLVFAPETQLGVAAVGGWMDGTTWNVFAGEDRLVSVTYTGATLVEAMLPDPFDDVGVRADGTSGHHVLFASPTSGREYVWDASPIACLADEQCPASATCGSDGACTRGHAPQKTMLVDHLPGESLGITWDGAQLLYVHPVNATPGAARIGALSCAGDDCVASSTSTIVLGDSAAWVDEIDVEALGPFARVAVALVNGEGIRAAFHDAAIDRQIAPVRGEAAWTLVPTTEWVESTTITSTRHDDPLAGVITTVLVAYTTEGDLEDTISLGGLRACESL